MADHSLAVRSDLPPLAARRAGTEAAYFTLRYNGGDLASDQMVLARLSQADPPLITAADMSLVLTVARLGVEAGLTANGGDPVEVFASASDALLRAITLADAGKSFFALVTAAEATPALSGQIGALIGSGTIPARVVVDQDDATLLAIADAAEAAGYLRSAAHLLATRSDHLALRALVARHADDAGLAALASGSQGIDVFAAVNGATSLAGPDNAAAQDIFTVLRGDLAMGPSGFLATYLNISGDVSGAVAAAEAVLAATQTDAATPPETLWQIARDALSGGRGAPAPATLDGWEWPRRTIRHYAGTVADTLATVDARAALTPVVAGLAVAGDIPPPAGVPDRLDWPRWQAVATALAQGTPEALNTPDDLVIAAELLSALDRWDDVATLVARMPPDRAVPVAADMMQRIDEGCLGAARYVGSDLFLSGLFIDFPQN
jgi:hypothetical protein